MTMFNFPRVSVRFSATLAVLALFLAATAVATSSTPTARAGGPSLDLVFMIDESGSMSDDIAAVRANVNYIATQLELSTDPRYALVGFGAYFNHTGEPYGQPHTHANFTDKAGLSTALGGMTAGGSNEPGVWTTSYAMNNVTGYRAGAGVCAVLITDEDSDLPNDMVAARAALDARSAVWFGVVNLGTENTATMYGPNAGSLSAHTGGAVFSIGSFRADAGPVLNALLNDCVIAITQGVVLTPATDTNYVGESHTVTATVKDNAGAAVPNVLVSFSVDSGPNAGDTDSGTTDSNGVTTFTYVGDGGVGTDTITASFVDSDGATQVSRPVQKTWERPPNEPPVANADGPYTVPEGSTVMLDASGSTDHDGPADIVSYNWDLDDDGLFDDASGVTVPFLGIDGPSTHNVAVEVCDDDGECDTASSTVDVTNVAPTVDAGADQIVYRNETVNVFGTWTDPAGVADDSYAWDWGIASGSAGYTGQPVGGSTSFPLEGPQTLTLAVTDKDSGTGSDTLRVTVLNQPPVCSAAAPSITEIWPPNHNWVDINVLGVTDPEIDDIEITIDTIKQDEPVDTYGDGKFTPDGQGLGTDTASVRAERAGTKKVPGDGRFYHIGFTADDGHGGACSATVQVVVPHDQSKGKNASDPIDGGPLYDSTALSP